MHHSSREHCLLTFLLLQACMPIGVDGRYALLVLTSLAYLKHRGLTNLAGMVMTALTLTHSRDGSKPALA